MKNILKYSLINILFLVATFLLCTTVDNSNAKILFMLMFAFGNAIYFLLSMKIFAANNEKPTIMLIINFLIIFAYLYLITNKIIIEYILFYFVFTFLGMKLGCNKKRISEFKKSSTSDGQK